MIIFREHRGTFADSMATRVELADYEALAAHICEIYKLDSFEKRDFEIKAYGFDPRIGGEISIVTVKGFGVVGFIDPLPIQAKGT